MSRIYTGPNLASNSRMVVWLHAMHKTHFEIAGIAPMTGRRFVIKLPQSIQDDTPDALTINDNAVFVGVRYFRLETFTAPIPDALK